MSADPILAAINRHRAAYEAFQVAPEGQASVIANDEYDEAGEALAATACASWLGALALLSHLRWWLADEAEFKDGHQPTYDLAEARVAEVSMLMGPDALEEHPHDSAIGTALQAIEFARGIDDHYDMREFLSAWSEGDLKEWPDFATFVHGASRAATPTALSGNEVAQA